MIQTYSFDVREVRSAHESFLRRIFFEIFDFEVALEQISKTSFWSSKLSLRLITSVPCTKCCLAYHPECLERFGWDEIEIRSVKDESSTFICPKCLLKWNFIYISWEDHRRIWCCPFYPSLQSRNLEKISVGESFHGLSALPWHQMNRFGSFPMPTTDPHGL